jgi:ATP-dependent DNA helicase RecQ
MDAEDRKDTYEKFKTGEIVVLFATKAFGMGMDIPNIHFVTHYSPPSTFEDFLQEVGRA